MSYTVGTLARLAGVSTRTLRYYEQIGLLRPATRGENGYRRYNEADALRLQQILFYRELGLRLEDIAAALDDPAFDALEALQRHRRALLARAERLAELLRTVERTILHLQGRSEMKTAELFEGFDDEQQRAYEKEAATRWGAEQVQSSRRRWDGYTAEQRVAIMAQGQESYAALAPFIGQDPTQPAVQAIIARWHQHLRYFYEPDVATLQGLGRLYVEDARFTAFYERIAPGLADFLSKAIAAYCEELASTRSDMA